MRYVDGLISASLRHWFGLAPMEAAIIWHIYKHPGQISYRQLALKVGCTHLAVKVHVSRFRQALGPNSLNYGPNNQWAGQSNAQWVLLTPAGHAEVASALQVMYAELTDVLYPKADAA